MPENTADGPDFAEIETILTAVEDRQASEDAGADDDRRDREYGVLTRIQAEVNAVVVSGGTVPGHDAESLRRLLEQINDAIDLNREG